ncbi:MAG: TetR/AcrR family transcriptional regulator [Polyangiaceae bacterium]
MAKQPPERRRGPQQARSRATVDFILEAAAQIVSKEGSIGLNTNRIAERAGVAVASLYQYFPNKEAILDALFEMQLSEERDEFARQSSALRGANASVREAIRVGLRSTLDVHARKPTLVRSILSAIPFLGVHELQVRARQEVVDAIAAAMRERQDELRLPKNLEMRAFLVVHAIEAAIHDAASERPEYLTDPAFADELAEMVERFLIDD